MYLCNGTGITRDYDHKIKREKVWGSASHLQLKWFRAYCMKHAGAHLF